MALAVVRSLDHPRPLRTQTELEDFEQELIDQYSLALAAAGMTDRHVAAERVAVIDVARFVRRPVWTVGAEDVDRYLLCLRRERHLAGKTVQARAWTLARFFEFLIARYQGDIHAVTGCVVTQPIDEFNRPAKVKDGVVRIPPVDDEVEALFGAWRSWLPEARKFLPAARDYLAASLWRRVGLRINETVMLDVGDWNPEFGMHGKLNVRFGKGSGGRGPKSRLVPGINGVEGLLEWWLNDVRYQFGDSWEDPAAPMLPSERRDSLTGHCTRVGSDALRAGLAGSVGRWLPDWSGRLSPHGLRHYCASSLYLHGMDLKSIGDLLGHQWLATTSQYVHVHDEHIEASWVGANHRVAARLTDLTEG